MAARHSCHEELETRSSCSAACRVACGCAGGSLEFTGFDIGFLDGGGSGTGGRLAILGGEIGEFGKFGTLDDVIGSRGQLAPLPGVGLANDTSMS